MVVGRFCYATTGADPLTGGEGGMADVAQAIAMFNAFHTRAGR
jgi:hypothetical protein